MEKFLDWLCGKADYTIIRCQKVTKDELRERIIESLTEDKINIENKTKQKDPCTKPDNYIICGAYHSGFCFSPKGTCKL